MKLCCNVFRYGVFKVCCTFLSLHCAQEWSGDTKYEGGSPDTKDDGDGDGGDDCDGDDGLPDTKALQKGSPA